jgi:hypothetical protein
MRKLKIIICIISPDLIVSARALKLRTSRDAPKYGKWTETESIPQSQTYVNYYFNLYENGIQIPRLEIGQ